MHSCEILQSKDLFINLYSVRRSLTLLITVIKHVENYPDFEKLAHVIHHGLQGVIVKNIEGESTEANDLSHIM